MPGLERAFLDLLAEISLTMTKIPGNRGSVSVRLSYMIQAQAVLGEMNGVQKRSAAEEISKLASGG